MESAGGTPPLPARLNAGALGDRSYRWQRTAATQAEALHVASSSKDQTLQALSSAKETQAENRLSWAEEFLPWWEQASPTLFDQYTQPAEYSAELQSAMYYFKAADAELTGELSVTEFREMCEGCGWAAVDIDASIELLTASGPPRHGLLREPTISLPDYISWYHLRTALIVSAPQVLRKCQPLVASHVSFLTQVRRRRACPLLFVL